MTRWGGLSLLHRKAIITIGCLVLVNIIVWIAAAIIAKSYPSLLGSMAVAFTLGLRHAVDADHLAAIDNVTRKLMYQQQRLKRESSTKTPSSPPVCVGLFFSLGHSTIVVVATVILAATATALKDKLDAFGETGGIIGTSVSAAFLFLIGIINLVVLVQVGQELYYVHKTGEYHYFDPIQEIIPASERSEQQQQNGAAGTEEEIKSSQSSINVNEQPNQQQHYRKPVQAGGLFARLFRPLFNLIDRSWKMYPLGVLFGLGFDTATQVGVLGIAAVSAHQQFSMGVILIFPALFTAGMSLIDTLDGILMANAYGWAFVNPVRKWYNFVVTLMGVLVAFVVGFAELFALLAEQLSLEGDFWDFFTILADHFGIIGYVIIGLFVVTWFIAVVVYNYGPLKDLEERVVVIQHTSMSPTSPGVASDLEKGALPK
ncbi:hypothetical protein BGW38_005039 [Lunasporangiospora selenospora]|uniref:Nickel/cobalt efflux system n=1 Tax=Lunasporangiospora selenospora TaxID=979761 RepID=A0A9P6G572_9FUNG|nr:hypothetical protein BGW38_005039 [Lunasporangiospora selenospora]